jgi:DDE domain
VVADLQLGHAVDLLRGQAAVTDKLPGGAEGEQPQPKAVVAVQPLVPGDPGQRLLAALGLRAIGTTKIAPAEVTTDQAPVYPAMLEDLLPAARHCTDQYANNRVECDHGKLKARLRPMRGLKQDRSARVVIAGHAFVQNLRRGHYELAVQGPTNRRVAIAFHELVLAI